MSLMDFLNSPNFSGSVEEVYTRGGSLARVRRESGG